MPHGWEEVPRKRRCDSWQVLGMKRSLLQRDASGKEEAPHGVPCSTRPEDGFAAREERRISVPIPLSGPLQAYRRLRDPKLRPAGTPAFLPSHSHGVGSKRWHFQRLHAEKPEAHGRCGHRRRRTDSGNTQILSARAARPQERGVSDHAGGDTSSTSSIRPRPQGVLCFDGTVYVTFMNSGTGDSDIHLFQTMKLPENLGSPAPGPAGLRERAVYEELPASERWEAL